MSTYVYRYNTNYNFRNFWPLINKLINRIVVTQYCWLNKSQQFYGISNSTTEKPAVEKINQKFLPYPNEREWKWKFTFPLSTFQYLLKFLSAPLCFTNNEKLDRNSRHIIKARKPGRALNVNYRREAKIFESNNFFTVMENGWIHSFRADEDIFSISEIQFVTLTLSFSLRFFPGRRKRNSWRPLNRREPPKIRTTNRFISSYISGLRKSEVEISGNIYGLTYDTSSDKTGRIDLF